MKSKLTRSEFLKLAGTGALVFGASLLLNRDSSFSWDGIDRAGSDQPVASGTGFGPRLDGPYTQRARCSGDYQRIDWQTATSRVAETLRRYAPGEIAFLLGLFPDHLNHLVHLLAGHLGGATVLRFDPLAEFEGRVTLMDAVQKLFGLSRLPLFDLSQADLIFSFGADLHEPWIAPEGRRPPQSARLLHFSARRPTDLEIDEWIPIRPGSEAVLAQWLSRSLAGRVGSDETRAAAAATGVGGRELTRFARMYSRARRRLALPSGAALSAPDGLNAAQWILSLNLPGKFAAKPLAFSLTTPPPLYPGLPLRPSNSAELAALFTRLRMGEIKAVFIHGIDPLGALPSAFGVREALAQAEQVISFSSFLDATGAYADLLLPDHLPSEMWGYQIRPEAADWGRVSAILPQAAPGNNTRSTADVLLAAIHQNGAADTTFDFEDERAFLRRSLSTFRLSPDIRWQGWMAAHEYGWQREHAVRFPPILRSQPGLAMYAGGLAPDQFYLQVYPDRAGRAQTTRLEIHPATAARLGLRDGEQVRVCSAHSQVSLPCRIHSGLHPRAAVLAWQPGSANPALDLLGLAQTASGGLVFSGLPVQLARG